MNDSTLPELAEQYLDKEKKPTAEESRFILAGLLELAKTNPVQAMRMGMILDQTLEIIDVYDDLVAPNLQLIPDDDVETLRHAAAYLLAVGGSFSDGFVVTAEHPMLTAIPYILEKLSKFPRYEIEIQQLVEDFHELFTSHGNYDVNLIAPIMRYSGLGRAIVEGVKASSSDIMQPRG